LERLERIELSTPRWQRGVLPLNYRRFLFFTKNIRLNIYMPSKSIDECLRELHENFDIVCQIICDYSDLELAKIDLFSKLKKVHQHSYDNDQRLIFVIKKDFYDGKEISGYLLKILQTMIRDIDISNFFVCVVTTNQNIKQEYQPVLENISQDSVPFHLFSCQGDFSRLQLEKDNFIGKLQNFVYDKIDNLTDQQKNLLFVDRTFCMMPWIGINIEPNSSVRPCCWFDPATPLGNVKSQSIKEIWNSSDLKKIRLNMLSNTPVLSCSACYQQESLGRDSLRKSINRDFAHQINIIDNTTSDGTDNNFSIKYWDIRHNNLCNFACRSCGPDASSSWHQIYKKIYLKNNSIKSAILKAGDNENIVLEQMHEHLEQVEKIYFAGGEPSMIEEFYHVLMHLIDLKKYDIALTYNLNLSRLTLKTWDLSELWKNFTRVSIGASLDAMGARAEYLRVGTVWQDIIDNRKKIQESCPHVDFYVSSTTGLINSLHVPDFHRHWVEQGLIGVEDFNIQMLLNPSWMSVTHAPRVLKDRIVDRYQQHLKWLRPLDRLGRASSGFQSIINLCQTQDQFDREKFWQEVNQLDQYYGTSLLEYFPELQDCGLE
jgi:MoaA/NifB/PqqE/SkfB family radical SAM enzyme